MDGDVCRRRFLGTNPLGVVCVGSTADVGVPARRETNIPVSGRSEAGKFEPPAWLRPESGPGWG